MKTFTLKDIKVVLCNIIYLGSIGYGNFAYSQTGAGVNTTTPKSNFEVNGSIAKKISTVTSDVTLDETHSIFVCDNRATEMTVNLPSATTTKGRIYTIKKGASTSDITIDATGLETIDGAATLMLADENVSITFNIKL